MKYIKSNNWFENSTIFIENLKFYSFKKKFPISDIYIDNKYIFNDLKIDEVNYMILNFNNDAWEPIWINEDNYLIDGQHRLCAAKKMGLKYIDVVIKREDK